MNIYHACSKLLKISKTKFNSNFPLFVCSLGLLMLANPIQAQEYVAIPDSVFEHVLIAVDIDKDGKNGKILKSSIDTLKTLDVSGGADIKSLEGIEAFTALKHLNCTYNSLEHLDLSKNLELQKLECSMNQLTSLNLSKNAKLVFLNISFNNLMSINLKNNPSLKELNCGSNFLDSLDVTRNIHLESINFSYNRLKTIDLSSNVKLSMLYGYKNKLSTLDVTQNPALLSLTCTENKLTALNLSNNTLLTLLSCENNMLESLDLSHNTALTKLACYTNELTSLDLGNNLLLKEISCGDNYLKTLDVSPNKHLQWMDCTSSPELKTICVYNLTMANSIFRKDDTAEWSVNCGLTGLSSAALYSDVILYPNPCNGVFSIETKKDMEVSIVNTMGMNVADLHLHSGQNIVSLTLQQGVYYLKREGQMLKFIIQ